MIGTKVAKIDINFLVLMIGTKVARDDNSVFVLMIWCNPKNSS